MDINQSIIIGRLTREPELKQLDSGKQVCKFSIANNGYKEEVNYIDVTCWEKTAANCAQFLKKGAQVAILGSLKQDRWQDNNGQNRSKHYINAITVQFLAKTGDNQQSNQAPPQNDNISYDHIPGGDLSQVDLEPAPGDDVPF